MAAGQMARKACAGLFFPAGKEKKGLPVRNFPRPVTRP